MKKKNVEGLNEKALELATRLKANIELLQKNGQDVAFIKTLESSARKTVRLEKEIVAQKERLKIKKDTLDLEIELLIELVENAKKIAKKELGKEPKQSKKGKAEKAEKKDKELKPEEPKETI